MSETENQTLPKPIQHPIQHRRHPQILPAIAILLIPILTLFSPSRARAEQTPQATAAFNTYAAAVESRLQAQHQSPTAFLANVTPQTAQQLRSGELVIEHVSEPNSSAEIPGALLHHWRGTAFAPGATAAAFEQMLRGFDAYPRIFAPQVLKAQAAAQPNGHLLASMRTRQKHVLTVVMDSAYDVAFTQLNPRQGSSISRSTAIAEIADPGAADEHRLTAAEEHGFLWRLNTYWTWEERDGGLYIQVESVSLTRSIPTGLGWVVRPFVESVPRDSLEFTLRSTCNALRK